MVAVQADPFSWAALAGETTAEDKKVLQPLGYLVASVRDQTVPAHGDPHTTREPVHKDCQAQTSPGEVTRHQHQE